jgi:hypothetical protein
MSKITRLLFATSFDSCLSISITLPYASTIAHTSMDCCISTCTYVDGYTYASIIFSSHVCMCIVCASTKCYSITSSSFDFSINTRSTNVAPSLVYSFARQLLLLLRKNSTTDVPIMYIS